MTRRARRDCGQGRTSIEGIDIHGFRGEGYVGAKQLERMKRRLEAENLRAFEQGHPEEPYHPPTTMNSARFSVYKATEPEEHLIVRPISQQTTLVNRVKYFPGPPKTYFVRYVEENINHKHAAFPPDIITRLPAGLRDRESEITAELKEVDYLLQRYEREVF